MSALEDPPAPSARVTPPSETATFLRAWLRRPGRIGALLPSGRQLARLITSEIGADDGPILELGGGTGAFTGALLDAGINPKKLYVLELDPLLARHLAERFPDIHLFCCPAQALHHAVPLPGEGMAAVISGLPLLSMSAAQQLRILSRCFNAMRPDGAFYQFTYSPACPVRQRIVDYLGLRVQPLGIAWRNCPPAQVFRLTRRAGWRARRGARRVNGAGAE